MDKEPVMQTAENDRMVGRGMEDIHEVFITILFMIEYYTCCYYIQVILTTQIISFFNLMAYHTIR